jgi:hypothetical protein
MAEANVPAGEAEAFSAAPAPRTTLLSVNGVKPGTPVKPVEGMFQFIMSGGIDIERIKPQTECKGCPL